MPRIEPPKITRIRPKTGPKPARQIQPLKRSVNIPQCKICNRPPHKARVTTEIVVSKFSGQTFRKREEHDSKLSKESFYFYRIHSTRGILWYGKHWRLIRDSDELFCPDCKQIGDLIYGRMRDEKVQVHLIAQFYEKLIRLEYEYRKDLQQRIPNIIIDEDVLYAFRKAAAQIKSYTEQASQTAFENFLETLNQIKSDYVKQNANQIESSNNSGTPIARHATGPNREENE